MTWRLIFHRLTYLSAEEKGSALNICTEPFRTIHNTFVMVSIYIFTAQTGTEQAGIPQHILFFLHSLIALFCIPAIPANSLNLKHVIKCYSFNKCSTTFKTSSIKNVFQLCVFHKQQPFQLYWTGIIFLILFFLLFLSCSGHSPQYLYSRTKLTAVFNSFPRYMQFN